VPTQRFDNIPLAAASTSLLSPRVQMSSYAAPLTRTHVMRAGAISADAEWPAEAIVNLSDLGRGVRWALAIEGAAALGIYAVWHLWRLWF